MISVKQALSIIKNFNYNIEEELIDPYKGTR